MKIAWVIDSSAGITKKEATKRGWYFLPLFLTIDDKEYKDGIDITAEEYYKNINIENKVRTSATPLGVAEKLLTSLTKKYDHVIVYPLSKGLSSQTSNLTILSKDFKNVHVVQSTAVGTSIVSDIEILEKMTDKNTIEEILVKANKMSDETYGFAIPATMAWLVKGGRVSSKAAAMANMLKIVPMIVFNEEGKLDSYGKGRTFKKTLVKAVHKLQHDVKGKDVQWTIYHGGNENVKENQKIIADIIGVTPKIEWFPPIIGNHVGPGVMALITHAKG